jgi:hypothetical protein
VPNAAKEIVLHNSSLVLLSFEVDIAKNDALWALGSHSAGARDREGTTVVVEIALRDEHQSRWVASVPHVKQVCLRSKCSRAAVRSPRRRLFHSRTYGSIPS